mmetsp:Transcript_35950/g.36179  ORF Transcript_35950/g.36179 Transcript_35950/m.36179 type:complete len:256 (+) Transcript_35950:144-911(+)
MSTSSENETSTGDGLNVVVETLDSNTSREHNERVLSLLVANNPRIHLHTTNFTAVFARLLERYLPGTRLAPLKQISDWINHPQTDQTIFWLTGDAGTGKSIISAKVLDLHHDNSLIGWHFCRHSSPLENSSIAIIESVSGIMASRLPEYERAILDVDQKALEKAKAEEDSLEFYRLLFTKPLNNMEPPKDKDGKFCRKFIIIDALDEIDDKHLDTFLRIARECFPDSPSWFGFFMTSRRYDKILRSLSVKVSLLL